MKTIINVMKMDFAICKKAMLIMMVSMVIVGAVCLFYFTPLLTGFFVVGATAVVSAIFAVESKSNMEYFYGCLPIRKSEWVIGRSLTCLLVLAAPSAVSLIFTWLGTTFSLSKNEEIKYLMELTGQYQMLILCGFIMIGFLGGTNLLLACFAGKLESREMLEVLLLLLEAVIVGGVFVGVKEFFFDGNEQEFTAYLTELVSNHETASCILLISAGIVFLFICSLVSIKIMKARKK